MSCGSSDPTTFCSEASPELKLYQAFIFSIPVFFTFVLLLLFYLFYLRRRRASWASIRMRIPQETGQEEAPRPPEPGIKKEVREMLPVVVFRESFLIRETQCSVCLGDYKADDRLKRIPPCGHTFHVPCIDHWLANNITCPLCRASLIPSPTVPTSLERPTVDLESQTIQAEQSVHEESEQRDADGNQAIRPAVEGEVSDGHLSAEQLVECVVNLECCNVQGNCSDVTERRQCVVNQNSVV